MQDYSRAAAKSSTTSQDLPHACFPGFSLTRVQRTRVSPLVHVGVM